MVVVLNGRSAPVQELSCICPVPHTPILRNYAQEYPVSLSPHSTGSKLGLLVASPSSLKSTLTPISFLNSALSLVPSRM